MIPHKNQSLSRGIIYLNKNGFYFFEEKLPQILSYQFPETMVKDYEVLDRDGFNTEIKSFVEKNKITPAHLLCVISADLIFEKTFTLDPHNPVDPLVQSFLENVPFENIAFRRIDTPPTVKITVINKDLCMAIKSGFELLGFFIKGFVYQYELGPTFASHNGLDQVIINTIFTRFDQLSKLNFIVDDIQKTQTPNNTPAGLATSELEKKIKKNSSLVVLVPVFFILIGVLVVLIISQNKQNKTVNTNADTISPPPIESTIPPADSASPLPTLEMGEQPFEGTPSPALDISTPSSTLVPTIEQ